MKKLIFFISMVFTINCWAGWTAVSKNTLNSTYYLDVDKIKQTENYIYLWYLIDYLEPIIDHPKYFVNDVMSETNYIKINCNKIIFQRLKVILYGASMATGEVKGDLVPTDNKHWNQVSSGTAFEAVIETVCGKGK